MIRELPILMSTEMVQATIKGNKSETRRLMKYKRKEEHKENGFPGELQDVPDLWKPATNFTPYTYADGVIYPGAEEEDDFNCYIDFETTHSKDSCWMACIRCPYGRVGDWLWVRERSAVTWSSAPSHKRTHWYYADNPEIPPRVKFKWKPSIHMEGSLARIWLELTEIKVERLHDITEEAAIAEGIEYVVTDMVRGYKDYSPKPKSIIESVVDTPIQSYQSLWHKINGEQSWKKNPWLWVLTFKVLSTTGRPKLA